MTGAPARGQAHGTRLRIGWSPDGPVYCPVRRQSHLSAGVHTCPLNCCRSWPACLPRYVTSAGWPDDPRRGAAPRQHGCGSGCASLAGGAEVLWCSAGRSAAIHDRATRYGLAATSGMRHQASLKRSPCCTPYRTTNRASSSASAARRWCPLHSTRRRYLPSTASERPAPIFQDAPSQLKRSYDRFVRSMRSRSGGP